MQPSNPTERRPLALIALVFVFFAPFIAAYWILSTPSGLDQLQSKAQGQWLTSDVKIQNPNHKWLILGVKDRLDNQQQLKLSNLHRALGKNREHVEVQWLDAKTVSSVFSDVSMDEKTEMDGKKIRKLIGDSNELPESVQSKRPVYIADPMGMILMAYHYSQIGKPLLDDIKHLVKHNPQ